MFIEHGQHNEVRCRVGTTHCLVCMKQFWDRDRLISHLTNASKGFAKTKQEVTFCKLCGPILPKARLVLLALDNFFVESFIFMFMVQG